MIASYHRPRPNEGHKYIPIINGNHIMKEFAKDIWFYSKPYDCYLFGDAYEDPEIGLIILVRSDMMQALVPRPPVTYNIISVAMNYVDKIIVAQSWEKNDNLSSFLGEFE